VPKPHPGVFRITKNIHNTLQGVHPEGEHISAEEKKSIVDWISDNAERYWFSDGGPLCRPDKAGADVVIVSLAAAQKGYDCVILSFAHVIVLQYNCPLSYFLY
jgi:hypothetical protein